MHLKRILIPVFLVAFLSALALPSFAKCNAPLDYTKREAARLPPSFSTAHDISVENRLPKA